MSFHYDYLKSVFANGFDDITSPGELDYTITNDPNITSVLIGIVVDNNLVQFYFQTALDTNSLNELNNLITTTYTPNPSNSVISTKTLQFSNLVTDFAETNYANICTLIWENPSLFNKIVSLKIVGYMETGGTSYTVRLYNVVERTILSLDTFNNTIEQIMPLTILLNQPIDISNLELQVKVSNTTSTLINIRNFTFDYQ